jgi:hypothetical protein
MKKAFAKSGLLAVIAASMAGASLTLMLARPAVAQGSNNSLAWVISPPVRLPNQEGQRFDAMAYLYSGSRGPVSAEVTFDIDVILNGPGGPTVAREKVKHPTTNWDQVGVKNAFTIIQNGQNFDLYQDGVLVRSGILNGLPPGTPIEGFIVTTNTIWTNVSKDALVGGSVQVVDSDGQTVLLDKCSPSMNMQCCGGTRPPR